MRQRTRNKQADTPRAGRITPTLTALVFILCAGMATASARIQVIGDSVMTWNGGDAIPRVIGEVLDEPIDNNARAGARMTQGNLLLPSVEDQFRSGDWDWVIINGGANDLNRACGCRSCAQQIEAMISQDAQQGIWVRLVDQVLDGGAAQVMIAGYYGPTGRGGRTDRCADELAIIDSRLAEFAKLRDRVHFVDADPVMGPDTPEFFSRDLIHPNARGSAAIGARIAAEILRLDPTR